jgi:16S rRNA (guanine527-N7)-methyltransferase
MLIRWNARVNLTAVRDPEEIVTRHFGESLFLARSFFPQDGENSREGRRVLDIGSGAGFPGLPLKIWNQEMNLTLIESNHKKGTFLREVARILGLESVIVRTDRAEALANDPSFHRSDFVTFRAVENFEKILDLAVTFLVPGGRLALLIGASQIGALSKVPGVMWEKPVPVPQSVFRILVAGALR